MALTSKNEKFGHWIFFHSNEFSCFLPYLINSEKLAKKTHPNMYHCHMNVSYYITLMEFCEKIVFLSENIFIVFICCPSREG